MSDSTDIHPQGRGIVPKKAADPRSDAPPLGTLPPLFRWDANRGHVCQACGRAFRRANASHGLMHERRGEARAFFAHGRWSETYSFEVVPRG